MVPWIFNPSANKGTLSMTPNSYSTPFLLQIIVSLLSDSIHITIFQIYFNRYHIRNAKPRDQGPYPLARQILCHARQNSWRWSQSRKKRSPWRCDWMSIWILGVSSNETWRCTAWQGWSIWKPSWQQASTQTRSRNGTGRFVPIQTVPAYKSCEQPVSK